MAAASEVEQEKRRRKPWMAMEVRGGGGGLLVLGGALIAAGFGVAFAARRAHVNEKKRRSSTTRPADEACKVEVNLDKGIGCDGEGGQLDEVGGAAVRGLASLLFLDPIPSTPSIKLAEDWPGEILIHSPVETQENMAKPRIDKSPTFKNLENSVNTEERMVETDDGGDDVVREFSLSGLESGTVQNQNKRTKEESELVKLEELKGEEEEFSFINVACSKIQDNNKQNLEEFRLDFVNAEEEISDGEEGEEAPSSDEVEEFSFRAVEPVTMHNQIKQTLEESKLVHAGEEGGGGGGGGEEESDDDVDAPSSESESQETETEPSVEEESEREEEGSDNTGASSPESSAEAVWPAEVIEPDNGPLLLQKHQDITEESHEEKVTTVKAGKETEKYDQEVAEKETAAEESLGRKMGTGPEMMKGDSKTGLMPVNYSNRLFLHLLSLALVLSLIFFAHRCKLNHLYEVFFPSDNVM